jgi:hypothetical protein
VFAVASAGEKPTLSVCQISVSGFNVARFASRLHFFYAFLFRQLDNMMECASLSFSFLFFIIVLNAVPVAGVA